MSTARPSGAQDERSQALPERILPECASLADRRLEGRARRADFPHPRPTASFSHSAHNAGEHVDGIRLSRAVRPDDAAPAGSKTKAVGTANAADATTA